MTTMALIAKMNKLILYFCPLFDVGLTVNQHIYRIFTLR
jgi:hypothetical protein